MDPTTRCPPAEGDSPTTTTSDATTTTDNRPTCLVDREPSTSAQSSATTVDLATQLNGDQLVVKQEQQTNHQVFEREEFMMLESSSISKMSRTSSKEDVITVKYLPMMSSDSLDGISISSEALEPAKSGADTKPEAQPRKDYHATNEQQQNNLSNKTRQSHDLLESMQSTSSESHQKYLPNQFNRIDAPENELSKDQPNEDQESKVRIVEHIRKNLTLFETNREIYELSPPYANRGHLQALLRQRQQQQQSQKHNTNNKSYSDQYTQYRPSDFTYREIPIVQEAQQSEITAADIERLLIQHHHLQQQQQHQYPTTVQSLDSRELKRQRHKTQQQADYSNKSKTVQQTQTKVTQPRQTDPLRRSVGSLGDLIKRRLEFVRRKVRAPESSKSDEHQQQSLPDLTKNPDKDTQQNLQNQQRQRQLSQHKTSTAGADFHSDNYSTSQSLYLLPAPDYRVHIATRVVKDIILAHQRAKNNDELRGGSLSTSNRLRSQYKNFKLAAKRSLRGKLTDSTPAGARVIVNNNRVRSRSLTSGNQLRSSTSSRDHHHHNKQQTTIDHSVNRIKAKVKMPSGKTDKAIIVDNKDGTIKISYEPKEVGQHEISLRYNDEPIEESPVVFYVDAVGSAKKKITAYGSGLLHGLVGETSKFTINTGGLGSSKLNVTVEGPSKVSVSLQDNKDGTISVSYVPLLAGEYKLKISFDGKQVVGSPFTTNITDEGRQRSHINVSKGSEHTLDLKISEDDLKCLNAIIVTPCGLEEPCALKLLKSGQLAIVFTPREQGDHIVNVKRQGNHIGGSPFRFDVLSRDIGDAKQVKVSGKGLKEGKTNADNEIVINTREAGFGGLSVALEGPGRSEISSSESLADGTIKLNYKPYEPGNYSLTIKYADHIVPGSPFNIKVSGQGTNPQKEQLRKFRKAIAPVDVNEECNFSFKMPGTSAYDLSAKLHSPSAKAEDASIKDKGDYVYQVSFTPKEVGLYSLSIRFKDIHIAGSPFPFTVGPMLDAGPHRVRCGGPGLIRGSCNKVNEFNVFSREAGAGELCVIAEGPSKPELSYADRKDGSCHIGYKVSEAGEYRFSVFFNDQEVPDSPFRAYIMPQSGEVAKIELGPMPPENMIQLNKPCNLSVIMNGAKGNIEGKVKLPSGKMEDCFASPIDAENWGVRFIPRELGVHQVHIKFNKGSTHIPQSPVLIRVGHDKADPAAVLAHGNGLKGAIVNHATDFIVETCNAGHAQLEVNIEGPSRVSMGCSELDEGYRVSYTPLAPGDYLIGIKYNGCHIGCSPFKIRAVKQPGSRTVADPGAHEISTISISTTDREAKQKVENMPKFKSDASRVYCKGMGLKKAFAGKPNTLTVNCSEAGFNMVYASFLGPTRNTIHECSVKHMGGSIYEVKYTCKDKGDAVLVVKYGDEQIPGSPFRLECV